IDFATDPKDGVTLDDFLKRSTKAMAHWVARRKILEYEYQWLQAREAEFMRVRKEKARADSAEAVRRVLADDEQRARTRADLHRQLQVLVDENAVRLGRKFRYGFHTKLNAETEAVSGQERGRINERRDTLLRLEDDLLTSQEFKIQAEKTGESIHSYVTYWTRWSFDGIAKKPEPKDEPVVVKDTPKEPVKETPKEPEKPKEPVKQEPPKKDAVKQDPPKKEIPKDVPKKTEKKVVERKVEAKEIKPVKGACAKSDMRLDAYTDYVQGLKRSCGTTDLPDLIIKRCEESFVTLDLSNCEKRQLYNFILFSKDNRYIRFDSLDYFEESCYAFQPFVELAAKYLADPSSALDFQEKARLSHVIDTAGRCPANSSTNGR
ncbi:MAG: hypothetical protein HY042_07075, partial [Spirochaetia bacterium]|nr:hypothetical protein [Spirochaetia bacterium]